MKEIPSPPGRSSSASAGSTLDGELKARCSHRKWQDPKDWRYYDSLAEPRDNCKKYRRLSSSSSQADSSLAISASYSSALSSRFRSRSNDSDRSKLRSRGSEERREVFQPMKHCLKKACDYCTYCLAETSKILSIGFQVHPQNEKAHNRRHRYKIPQELEVRIDNLLPVHG